MSYSVCPWQAFPACLCVRPGANPRMKQLKGALLMQALALLPIIRLGRKSLPRISALAHYKHFCKLKMEKVLQHSSLACLALWCFLIA
jgi:hypothetical protein